VAELGGKYAQEKSEERKKEIAQEIKNFYEKNNKVSYTVTIDDLSMTLTTFLTSHSRTIRRKLHIESFIKNSKQ